MNNSTKFNKEQQDAIEKAIFSRLEELGKGCNLKNDDFQISFDRKKIIEDLNISEGIEFRVPILIQVKRADKNSKENLISNKIPTVEEFFSDKNVEHVSKRKNIKTVLEKFFNDIVCTDTVGKEVITPWSRVVHSWNAEDIIKGLNKALGENNQIDTNFFTKGIPSP